ncbi:L-lactate dehydrogenase [Salibacterium aidingense]|uniref:L-lactate dehydrogenase n=1 Tax=Salibacterium aidingense TaxID=384933 RepID=UPI003BBC851E
MKHNNVQRVVIIGAGAVGCSYAYSLLHHGTAGEIVLIDVHQEKAAGEAMDLNHGVPFAPAPVSIWSGDFTDCREADLIVMTAGLAQKPGETRLDLLTKNTEIFEQIVRQVMENGFDGIFLVATNPVDLLTYVTWKASGLSRERVIGSGTVLDSARLRYMLGDYFDVDARNIHAAVIGEHGDTELPVWSHATVGMQNIKTLLEEKAVDENKPLDTIFENVRDAAYHIIQRKGATHFGIGMSLLRITKAILNDEQSVMTVSAYLDGEYGQHDMYIGVPAVLGRGGVREIIEIELNPREQEQFTYSANVLKKMMKQAAR